MRRLLEQAGYETAEFTPGETAGDVLVINSCTVTGESDSLSDDALAARLHDLRSLAAAEIDDGASSSSLAWVFIVCAVVIFTLTIAVILGRRQDEELAREKQAKK